MWDREGDPCRGRCFASGLSGWATRSGMWVREMINTLGTRGSAGCESHRFVSFPFESGRSFFYLVFSPFSP